MIRAVPRPKFYLVIKVYTSVMINIMVSIMPNTMWCRLLNVRTNNMYFPNLLYTPVQKYRIFLPCQNMVFNFNVWIWNFSCSMLRSFAFIVENIMSVCHSVKTVWTFKCSNVWKRRCQKQQHGHRYGNILMICDTINTFECFFFCDWHELCSSSKLLDFSIIYCFLVKHAIKYQTWMSSYPTPCYADMQGTVPSD